MMFSTFLRKQQLSRWFNLTLSKSINGKRFWIPVFFKMGTGNFSMTEMWMLDVLQRISLNASGVFVDIGANIGQTLIKLRSVSSEIPYVGIEPNPSCVFYLHELIRQNKFEHCRIVPTGVYLETDLLKLTFRSDDDTDSSATLLAAPDSHAVQSQFVPLLSFDLIRKRLGIDSISVIKIDVEGVELEVLQSLEPVLDSLLPLLLLEILPVYDQKNVERLERQNQVEALLASHNYSLARICKTANGQLAGLKPIRSIGIHSDLSLSDYLAYPSEIGDSILSKFKKI
jgi:FkbM family methyltransferase